MVGPGPPENGKKGGTARNGVIAVNTLPTGAELHDRIAAELFGQKSVAALLWLIPQGRELEFSCAGEEWFLSMDGSQKTVSLWNGAREQAFADMESLLVQAEIGQEPFLLAWEKAELDFLF